MSVLRTEGAEQAVCLVSDAGREEQCVAGGGDLVAEQQPPQAVDLDGVAVTVGQGAPERAAGRVVAVDEPVAEVTAQKGAAEIPQHPACPEPNPHPSYPP